MATAESITINCRACEHSQEMPASYSGRVVRCASCGERMRAPVSEADKQRAIERRDRVSRTAAAAFSQAVRVLVNLVAVVSVLAALAVGGWTPFATTMIFWSITFTGWEIVNRLDTIADLLRRKNQ